jgi:hypothetical protein
MSSSYWNDQAVMNKYLSSPNKRRLYHRKLADFFAQKSLTPRKLSEYPYHLKILDDKNRLKEFLKDISVFNVLYNDFDKYDLFMYWQVSGGMYLTSCQRMNFYPQMDSLKYEMK